MESSTSSPQAGGVPHHSGGSPKPPTCDVKPRLTKKAHNVLEQHFQKQHSPGTLVKKSIASELGVPLDQINNWYQNRRSRFKKDNKKRANQRNMPLNSAYNGSNATPPGFLFTNSHRSSIPNRDNIDVIRPHSASWIRSAPDVRKTFSLTPSQASLSEMSIVSRSARPRVFIESMNGLEEAPPACVNELGEWLARDVGAAFIPQYLQHTITNDLEVCHQITRLTDFDTSDMRSAEDLSSIYEAVKTIYLNARDCQRENRDDNAWCDDVVRPLLQLAMKMYGNGKWWLQSVHSQPINPLYLPTTPAPPPSEATCRKTVDHGNSYILSYSHRDPTFADLYRRLAVAGRSDIGHTLDEFTMRTALFSGFEVRAASGDHTEAELQMSSSIAAALLKKQSLAHEAQIPSGSTIMVEPAVTVIGHKHSFYYAYPRADCIHVLGPDVDRFGSLSTESFRGICGLLRVYGNLLEFGEEYWARFFGPVLEKLASDPRAE